MTICMANPLVTRLCDVLELDPGEVSCITIVCAADDVIRVKVERFGNEDLEKFDFESLVEGAPIS